jgi:hypothetical protein
MVSFATSEATRLPVARWGGTRMWLGIGLVLLSVLGVVALVSTTDRRSTVWALRHDLAAGSVLQAEDLDAVAVRVPDLGTYVSAGRLVAGEVLARDVTTGELLPAAALVPAGAAEHRLVTVPVERYHLPADLERGQRVDVYLVVRGATDQPVGDPVLVLRDVTVAAVDDDAGGFGGSSLETGVVLTVAPQQVDGLVGAASRGSLTLVRVPGATT